jgi:hypothetical protein
MSVFEIPVLAGILGKTAVLDNHFPRFQRVFLAGMDYDDVVRI